MDLLDIVKEMKALAHPKDTAELRRLMEAAEVEFVRLMTPDANGCARGKVVPREKFLASLTGGWRFARSLIVQDVDGENSPVEGFDFQSGDADMLGVVVPESYVVTTWRSGSAQVVLQPTEVTSGAPLPHSCRTALQRVVTRAEALGLTTSVASELEFYLFDPATRTPRGRGKSAYGMIPLQRLGSLAETLLEATAALGLHPEGCLHEYAPGQIEINFAPADAMAMADRTFYFRHMVKELAIQHRLEATFMAKPFAGESGSGFHVNVSLWRGDANVFDSGTDDAPTEAALQFVAGNQARARELFALFAPNVNSFRRYVLGEYVPSTTSWGGDDRTVALRLPSTRGGAARVEHRLAGADANPYLVLAAVLAAGLDGMERGATPPADTAGRPGHALPDSVAESLAALESSAFAREALGTELVDTFLAVKRQEWAKFQGTISDWEFETYGNAL